MKSRLRAVREAQGIGIQEISRRVGYDVAYVSRVERGLQRPSVDLLLALARELGLKNVVDAIRLVWEEQVSEPPLLPRGRSGGHREIPP